MSKMKFIVSLSGEGTTTTATVGKYKIVIDADTQRAEMIWGQTH